MTLSAVRKEAAIAAGVLFAGMIVVAGVSYAVFVVPDAPASAETGAKPAR